MTEEAEGANEHARERVWKLEQELAHVLQQHNEETGGLHKEIARLRASLEQNEAEKQRLEYILLAAKQELRKAEEVGLGNEQKFTEVTETLQSRVVLLTKQCEEWSNTLNSVQQARAEERQESQHIITAKEVQLTNLANQNRKLEAELEQLNSSLMNHVGSLEDLEVKLTALEVECEEKTAAVLQQGREIQQANQQQHHLMEQLQDKLEQIKILEDSVQAEKAAHLDCKFSAEIAQLRLKELECTIEADKDAVSELSAMLEQANENISKLQQDLDKENCAVIELSDQLLSKELECAKLEQKAQDLASEKDALHADSLLQAKHKINLLQTKLDHSCKEEAELKDQITDIAHDLLSALDALGGRPNHAEATPTELLHLLKSLLSTQQQKVLLLAQNLKTANQNEEQFKAECTRYKEILTSRSSAITDAEGKLAHYSEQLSRLQVELSSVSLSHNEKCQKLQLQVDAANNQLNTENECHCRYLHSIYTQLTSTDITSSQQKQLAHFMGNPPSNYWARLSSEVTKEAANTCDRIRSLSNKVTKLETICEQLRGELAAKQQEHQLDVHQFTQQQVHQLEQCDNYKNQLRVLDSEVKKLQTSCHGNADQIVQLTKANQVLHKQGAQYKATIEQLNVEKHLLIPGLAMLVGTIFPLLARQQQLILQKAILSRQLDQLQKLHYCVTELTDLLESVSDPAPPMLPCPLAKFRKVVLVVLAANRLVWLRRQSSCILVGHLSSSPVVTIVTMHSGGSTGLKWLNDYNLLDDIICSLSGINIKQWDQVTMKACYCKLLEQLSKHFTSSSLAMDCYSHISYPFPVATSNQSLWQRLRYDHGNTRSPKELSALLRAQLLTLTGKLHDGELDRHNLHQQLLEANINCQQLSSACNDALAMTTTVDKLQLELQQMITVEQYDAVTSQLQLSQQQMNEQQDVINHHANRIKGLDKRLTATLQELNQRDESLAKTTLELGQLKEQVIVQQHQLKDTSLHCQNLQQQLSDVQRMLNSATSEQQALEHFIATATATFQESQRKLSSSTYLEQQLRPLLLEESNLSAAATTNCQEMIKQLISAHQASLEMIASLKAQVDSYRSHTIALKGELSAACRRQLTSIAASLDCYQEDESLDSSDIAKQGALLGVSMAKSLNMMQQD